MVQVTQAFRSELSNLQSIRTAVCDACQDAGTFSNDQAALDLLEVAVGEAATNIMLHAYEGATTARSS